MKHTKGPWRSQGSCVISSEGEIVAAMVCGQTQRNSPEEDHATSDLIAAAPEMLEALIKWHKIIFDNKYTDDSMRESESSALIEKATGLPIHEVLNG